MSKEVKEFMQEVGRGKTKSKEEKDGKDGNFSVKEKEEVAEDFTPSKIITLVINERGKLVVEIYGEWAAREIRAIQLAVIKAYKRKKYEQSKEMSNE